MESPSFPSPSNLILDSFKPFIPTVSTIAFDRFDYNPSHQASITSSIYTASCEIISLSLTHSQQHVSSIHSLSRSRPSGHPFHLRPIKRRHRRDLRQCQSIHSTSRQLSNQYFERGDKRSEPRHPDRSECGASKLNMSCLDRLCQSRSEI